MKRVRITYYPSDAETSAFHNVCMRENMTVESRDQAWLSALITGRSAFNIYRYLDSSTQEREAV